MRVPLTAAILFGLVDIHERGSMRLSVLFLYGRSSEYCAHSVLLLLIKYASDTQYYPHFQTPA